ncbi:SusC/RagA family TonB-linked outer membrane protein [Aliifodinibius sp. S!AR15-10]|uniref:SusC/RagA family TonB-linked outer membrane protein n=1 Tax=Aliifodinibius sp. S!AR15-10 TaxID=2950437 RepID=UPI002857E19F|nr:SusC/RagA family TonB-linked outer membrane protein [Aliifodinibius sp. S!AR15-10]MDR8392810.1 SusC/RagA family TonB-linked outer membrane protein [Aliifodinibius sp. S!AR15-10]
MKKSDRSFSNLLLVLAVATFLLGFSYATVAQFTVSGTVTEEQTDQPLIGVTIQVQETGSGVVTNSQGEYEIELQGSSATLVFSYIGYQTKTFPVDSNTGTLDVTLRQDIAELGEVVVSGLGTTVKRENLANSVSSISAEELIGKSPAQTLSSNLYGKVTGAEISANSGAPGGGISIRLRGVTSINGASQPLYIVDGIYYNNDDIPNGSNAVTAAAGGGSASNQDNPVNRIADLNPEDIESIEILKGASAAAIYGQRASGGVVIITTKRGTSGGPLFSLSQRVGFTTIQKKLGMRDFTVATADSAFGSTGRTLFEEAQSQNRFIDYEEEMYGQEGLLSKTTLSTSFGNENTSFFVSGSLQDDEGIIPTTGYERQSIRANMDHRFSPSLNVAVSSNYVHSQAFRGLTNNDNSGTTFGVAMTATPNFIDLRPNEDGLYPDHPFNTSNPLQTRDLFSNGEGVDRVSTSVKANFNIWQKPNNFLTFTFNGGVDFFSQNNKLIFPSELQFERISGSPGTLIETATDNLNTNTSAILVHTFTTGNNLTITSQAGYTSFNNDQNRILTIANNILGTQTNVDQAVELNADQTKVFQRDRGFFLQEELNFDDTYIFTAGLRFDKSDRNGDVGKFYLYPKASLAWNLTNEDFWNSGTLENLKLRVAFGQTGNLSTFGAKFTSLGPSNIAGLGGVLIDETRGVENLKPERQTEIEAGIDASLASGFGSLELTVYQKSIEDMLLQRELEPSTGFDFESFNSGSMWNRGVEVGLNLLPFNTANFRWNSSINFWKNWSKVTDLPVPPFDIEGGGFGTSLGQYRIEEGESATQIVGSDPELDTNGDLVYRDDDGNVVSEEEGSLSIITKKLGDGEADFQMSFSNDVRIFNNLSLNFLLHWKKGGDNLNLTELLFDLNGTTNDYDDTDLDIADFRLEAAGLDGTETNAIKRLALLGISADHFIQDASYLRMREIGLYYDVPVSAFASLNNAIRGVRVGVSATNLFTITPYRSYDPEVSNFGNQPIGRGVEVTPFPSSKQFYAHLNIDF